MQTVTLAELGENHTNPIFDVGDVVRQTLRGTAMDVDMMSPLPEAGERLAPFGDLVRSLHAIHMDALGASPNPQNSTLYELIRPYDPDLTWQEIVARTVVEPIRPGMPYRDGGFVLDSALRWTPAGVGALLTAANPGLKIELPPGGRPQLEVTQPDRHLEVALNRNPDMGRQVLNDHYSIRAVMILSLAPINYRWVTMVDDEIRILHDEGAEYNYLAVRGGGVADGGLYPRLTRWARTYNRDRLQHLLGTLQWSLPAAPPRPRRGENSARSGGGGERSYAQHRNRLMADHYANVTNLDLMPLMPHGKLASRRWGIEVETGAGRNLGRTPSGWDAKDDGSLESAYGAAGVSVWDCYYSSQHDVGNYLSEEHVGDEYVRVWDDPNEDYINPIECEDCGTSDDWDDADCVELVSPILTSFHSNGLESICSDLEGAPTTESAGIHVHVDVPDLDGDQIRTLLFAYDQIEHLIESSYKRDERGYCRRRSERELLALLRDNSSKESMRTGERYVTVNLNSLGYHGTVEFRAMGPVYDYEYLTKWAMFCREMVNASKKSTPKEWARVRTWDDLTAMFTKYGVEYNRANDLALAEAVEGIDAEAIDAEASEVVEV